MAIKDEKGRELDKLSVNPGVVCDVCVCELCVVCVEWVFVCCIFVFFYGISVGDCICCVFGLWLPVSCLVCNVSVLYVL